MALALTFGLVAADYVDAPDVATTTTYITDFYAFEGATQNNTVFVANVQGLLPPGSAAQFDENILTITGINFNKSTLVLLLKFRYKLVWLHGLFHRQLMYSIPIKKIIQTMYIFFFKTSV